MRKLFISLLVCGVTAGPVCQANPCDDWQSAAKTLIYELAGGKKGSDLIEGDERESVRTTCKYLASKVVRYCGRIAPGGTEIELNAESCNEDQLPVSKQ